MRFSSDKELFLKLSELREKKQLHSFVENRLDEILTEILPEYRSIKEPQGLAGGRNDLIAFNSHGRKVLFEVFATKSQVSRDLRILDNTKADVKICIVIDHEIDAGVWEKIQKENPENNYPYLFTKELFLDKHKATTALRLRELVTMEEDAIFHRLLDERISVERLIDMWRIEGLAIIEPKDLGKSQQKYQSIFNLTLAKRLLKLGMLPDRVKDLIKYLSNEELAEFVLTKIGYGFNILLCTDLRDDHQILSDQEFLDIIDHIHEEKNAFVIISLNNIAVSVIEGYFKDIAPAENYRHIGVRLGRSTIMESNQGRLVTLGLPVNTKQIMFLRPYGITAESIRWNEETSDSDIINMIDINGNKYKSNDNTE